MRLIFWLVFEFIIRIDLHLGLLHRGTEKLSENKIHIEVMPYMDRLDYVSTISQEETFAAGIEMRK